MSKNRPTRLMRAEEVFTEYCHVLPDGYGIDDALKSETWEHVAKQLRRYDRIRVIAEDGSFEAMLTVIVAEGMFVKLVELYRWELEGGTVAAPKDDRMQGFEIKHHPTLRWRVIRKGDGQVLKEGLLERSAANDWLHEHLKTIAA